MQKIKQGDDVIVLTGRDKGKVGNVLRVLSADRVLVNNVNLVKRHTKPNPAKGTAGGILEKEAPLHVSNVALYNPQTKRADRVGVKHLEDGRKVRIFRSTGEVVDI